MKIKSTDNTITTGVNTVQQLSSLKLESATILIKQFNYE